MADKGFTEKLKDDFLAVIIGVLVGLPALGIVVPKIFFILGNQDGIALSGLFKIFSLVYFTMPLILLFGLSFFQFTNDLVIKLRKLVWGIIVLIGVVFLMLMLPFWRNEASAEKLFTCVAVAIAGLWYYYWWSFRHITAELYLRIRRLNKRLENLGRIKPANRDERQVITTKMERVSERLAESIASIKLGIFYLFISSQLVVVVLLTIFNKIYNNIWCLAFMMATYSVVFIYYQKNQGLRELRAKKALSNSFMPYVLLTVMLAIGIIFYVARMDGGGAGGNTSTFSFSSVGGKSYIDNFNGLDEARKTGLEISSLDSTYKDLALSGERQKAEMLPLDFLNNIVNAPKLNADSVSHFDAEMSVYGNFIDTCRKKATQIDTFIFRHSLGPGNARDLSNAIGELEELARTADKGKIAAQQSLIRQNGLYRMIIDTLSRQVYDMQLRQHMNRLNRGLLLMRSGIQEEQVKKQQIAIIGDMQRAGVIIFMTTLIVLLSFLLILHYRDDQFHLETLPEVVPIRKILQIVCLITAILLVPLIKFVPEDEVNADRPATLFLAGNWNLAKSFTSEEEPSKPAASAKYPVGTYTDAGGVEGQRCPVAASACKSCTDTLIIKYTDSTIINLKTVITAIVKQLKDNTGTSGTGPAQKGSVLDSYGTQAPADGNIALLTSYLLEISADLKDNKTGQNRIHGAVDSAVRELDTIENTLRNGQYKSNY